MNYNYTKHILKRMLERNITNDEIETLLNNEVDILIIPSKKDENVFAILGFIEEKGIVLFVNKNNKNLITTRKMRDNEKKLFLEKINEKK